MRGSPAVGSSGPRNEDEESENGERKDGRGGQSERIVRNQIPELCERVHG